jgi:hypothetical protein
MQSAKLPLVGGIIYPLHNGPIDLSGLTVIGGPVDKALTPAGVQAFYETHLWLVPSAVGGSTTWVLLAAYDSDLLTTRFVSKGVIAAGDTYPVKILDGYPMRGNVSLSLAIVLSDTNDDQHPNGAQMYGYAYRVGQGDVNEPERRFIGAASPDGVSAGVPLLVPAGNKVQLHKFEKNRFDEVSLAFQPVGANPANAKLYFEDANDVPVAAPGHYVQFKVPADTAPNYERDPQSAYTIKGASFGSAIYQQLDHISIESDEATSVHGYFTRR